MDAVWNLLAPVLGWAGEMLAGKGELWQYAAIFTVLSKMNKADFVVIGRFFTNFVQMVKGGFGGIWVAIKIAIKDGTITDAEAKEVGDAVVKAVGYFVNSVLEFILVIIPILNFVISKFRKVR